jgi:hypothetical protein
MEVEVLADRVEHEGRPAYLTLVRDITAQKATEAHLLKAKEATVSRPQSRSGAGKKQPAGTPPSSRLRLTRRQDEERCLAAGMDGYVVKAHRSPINPSPPSKALRAQNQR